MPFLICYIIIRSELIFRNHAGGLGGIATARKITVISTFDWGIIQKCNNLISLNK
jgi:hypothetical protein